MKFGQQLHVCLTVIAAAVRFDALNATMASLKMHFVVYNTIDVALTHGNDVVGGRGPK